ncbi:Retrovirus-related Pol polyprotein from transposon 17.6 [Dictyocoela muelleri]|nr:Retrovirus-related Pol polyprotein from transposon 17.6 [Dictyocoela muelleri]
MNENALIDTGASNSFISKKLVKTLSLKIENDINSVVLANGRKIFTKGFVNLNFYIENNKKCLLKQKFDIIENLDSNIIFGLDFLTKEKVNIDLNNMTLNFPFVTINLDSERFYSKYHDPDNSFFENTKLNKINMEENYEEKITYLINNFKNKNCLLKKIPDCYFRIALKDLKIIKKKPYPIPYKYFDDVKNEVKNLLDQGIITHSKSDYASPAFLIIKRNGDIRLVVDYRALNNILDDSGYPFPEIWNHIYTLKGKNYFSQLDITKGFHNIQIHEQDRKFSSFVLPWGQYEYTRVPFGIKTAPRFFQSIMSDIFRDLPYVKIFIDDLLISSNTIEEHYVYLKEVLNRLSKMNISINFGKSNFCLSEVVYLGNKISKYGIQADISRVDSIYLKIPKMGRVARKKVKSIIGTLEWFRPFISNFSNKISKLNIKTKKNGNLIWDEEDKKIVENMIYLIKKNTLLVHPDLNKEFVLECDASNYSIGSVF